MVQATFEVYLVIVQVAIVDPLLYYYLSLETYAMVRLITHNLLACHVKGCTSNNFPLEFKDVQIELREAEFNPDFLRGFMPKIEWKALVDAARQVCLFVFLPLDVD